MWEEGFSINEKKCNLTPGGDFYVFIFVDHSDEVVILDLDVLAKETKIA